MEFGFLAKVLPCFWFHEARVVRWDTGSRLKTRGSGITQVVTPSTWNAGPRGRPGQRGPYEAALRGTPIADPDRPLESCALSIPFDLVGSHALFTSFGANGRPYNGTKLAG